MDHAPRFDSAPNNLPFPSLPFRHGSIACPVEIMEIVPPSARDTCQNTDPKVRGRVSARRLSVPSLSVCVCAR